MIKFRNDLRGEPYNGYLLSNRAQGDGIPVFFIDILTARNDF